jgi:uncharacterized membrane protein YkoI
LNRYSKISFLAVTIATASFAVFANKGSSQVENDALSINQAQITLSKAISIAENQYPGSKASKAEFEYDKKIGWVYDIEVIANAKAWDIKVDPQKGVIVSALGDGVDHDDDRDGD